MVYPGFYVFIMNYLLFSTVHINFIERCVDGIGEYSVGEYNNIVVIFACISIV